MKPVICTIVALSTLAAFAPASAQTYDPRYPVCMRVYGERIGDRMDCIFTSIPQCQASASGLPATCLINPYFANARELVPARRYGSRAW